MCINTQINLACGHATRTRHYTSLHCRLSRHTSPLGMLWRDRICKDCRGRRFAVDMVRVVEWLGGVEEEGGVRD